jgi:hypothetical protein
MTKEQGSVGSDDLAIIEEFVRRNVGGQPALDAIARLRSVPQTAREWRCFHCGDVFTDEDAAKDHFGYDLLAEPGCKLNAIEGGLLGIVRRQDEQLQAYHREDTASYREFYSLGADHSRALIREEQKGYEKGLADARSDAVQAILKAPCLDENGYICEKAAVMAAFDPPLSRPDRATPSAPDADRDEYCAACGRHRSIHPYDLCGIFIPYDNAISDVLQTAWQCTARKQGTPGGNDPADCDWPGCGCDPAANKILEAIDEAGFEITKKPDPVAWDAPYNRSYEPVETLAKVIYHAFAYDGPAGTTKPGWTPGGNGTKQDEARDEARQHLRQAGHTPALASHQRNTQGE